MKFETFVIYNPVAATLFNSNCIANMALMEDIRKVEWSRYWVAVDDHTTKVHVFSSRPLEQDTCDQAMAELIKSVELLCAGRESLDHLMICPALVKYTEEDKQYSGPYRYHDGFDINKVEIDYVNTVPFNQYKK